MVHQAALFLLLPYVSKEKEEKGDTWKGKLMKIQMKLYAKDLMTEYANNFDREIFVDESKLPNKSEKKELEKETQRSFNEYLKI